MAKAKTSRNSISSTMTVQAQTWRDAKTAILLVSILINAFILIGWAVLKLTNQYDAVLAATLLGR